MFESLLRTVSVVTCLFVLAGWTLFGVDQTRGASLESQREIAGEVVPVGVDPPPKDERAREAAHSTPREFVDDVNDVLLSPFAGLVDSSGSAWVRHSVPALLALLAYGFGLGYLARFARGRA